MSTHMQTLVDLLYYMDKVIQISFLYNGTQVNVIAKVVAVVSGAEHYELHLSLSEFDGRQIRFLKAVESTNTLELVPKSWDPTEQCSFVCHIRF